MEMKNVKEHWLHAYSHCHVEEESKDASEKIAKAPHTKFILVTHDEMKSHFFRKVPFTITIDTHFCSIYS